MADLSDTTDEDGPLVVPAADAPWPGITEETAAALDAIDVDLRGGYTLTGETINDDPAEYADVQFVRLFDIPAIIRAWVAAALPVLNAAKESETAELLRAAVFEISHMRADWVNAYVDRAQKAWRGGSWRSADADRIEREAITKWNANHPGLIALWKSHQNRAASLRGEQGE